MDKKNSSPSDPDFRKEAAVKEERKLKAERKKHVDIGLGFRIFGLVGWAIILPILIAIAIGLWIDHHRGVGSFASTLICMVMGVFIGIATAMFLIAREMFKKEEDENSKP